MARCGCPCHHGSKIPGFAISPNLADWLDALIACELCERHHAPAQVRYGTRWSFLTLPWTPPPAPPPLDFTNDDTHDNGG